MEFKLVRVVKIYEEVIVQADSKEQALEMYHNDEVEGWEEEDVSGSESRLIGINERGDDGTFSIQHDVEEGAFIS